MYVYIYIYIHVYTRVERALRARTGPWALVGPPLGPWPSPGPSGGPAEIGPCRGPNKYVKRHIFKV